MALPSVSSTFMNEFMDGLKHMTRLVTADNTRPRDMSFLRLNLSARKTVDEAGYSIDDAIQGQEYTQLDLGYSQFRLKRRHDHAEMLPDKVI